MSTAYNMVLTSEYYGEVKRGAFDHWQGETIPVRGPNREIIGEVTIKDVDHREDGNVWVIVESELDMDHHIAARIASLLRGRNPMSISVKPEDVAIPHQPKRDDDVARWLKAKRDEFMGPLDESTVDELLDEYRARADYGLTLSDDITQLEGKW